MADFPKLKTGAVTQYPVSRRSEFATQVLSFVDGTEQRYRAFPASGATWIIQLSLLDDAEALAIDEFFASQQGALQDFSFEDPWDGTIYPSCRITGDTIELGMNGERRSHVSLVVKENRL